MNADRESRGVDPRLHAYLDGDLPSSEAAAFEGDLRSGSITENQLDSFKRLSAWFRVTRPRAPFSLAASVERAIAPEPPLRSAPVRKPVTARPLLRWAWIPAAAAVAALFSLLTIPRDRAPGSSDGVPRPPEGAGTAVSAPSNPENTVRCRFTVKAGDAQEVCLAGDFNKWRVCEAPLQRVGEGLWAVSIDLPRGRHEYMFVIDGRWVTDPKASLHADDGFGNRNAILIL